MFDTKSLSWILATRWHTGRAIFVGGIILCPWGLEAMTPDRFAEFLSRPPSHGRMSFIQVTPVAEPEPGMTNRVVQVYRYAWDGTNVFGSLEKDGRPQKQSGTFCGADWNIFENCLTRFGGENEQDNIRRLSPLVTNLRNMLAMGVYHLRRETVEVDGLELRAEIDVPGLHGEKGGYPRMLGRLETLRDGSVKSLNYKVSLPGHEQTIDWRLEYEFNGSWGAGYPSHIEVYTSALGGNVPRLLYKVEVHSWNVEETPGERELNPAYASGIKEEMMLSNNVVLSRRPGGLGGAQWVPLRNSEVERHTYLMKSRYAKIFLAVVFASPPVVWIWHKLRRESRRRKQTTGN